MKVQYTKGNLTCICEGTPQEVFAQVAEFTETFQDECCGAYQCKDISYVVRKNDEFDFLEAHCNNLKCRARLSFGAEKGTGKLYPRRLEVEHEGKNKGKAVRGADGKAKYLPNKGWTVYKKESSEEK